jgi:hypothetical protein
MIIIEYLMVSGSARCITDRIHAAALAATSMLATIFRVDVDSVLSFDSSIWS